MNEQVTKLDFSRFDGPLFAGRKRGESSRIKANLDLLDMSNEKIIISIPRDFLTITSSFFLGMFDKSIQKCGTKEKFLEKYDFGQLPQGLRDQLPMWIDRALTPNKFDL